MAVKSRLMVQSVARGLAALITAVASAARALASCRARRRPHRLAVAMMLVPVIISAALSAARPVAAGFTLAPSLQPDSPGLTIPNETVVYGEETARGIALIWHSCPVYAYVNCPTVPKGVAGSSSYEEAVPLASAPAASTDTSACAANPSHANCDTADPAATGCASNSTPPNQEVTDGYDMYVDNRWSTKCTSNWTRVFYTDNYWRELYAEVYYTDNSEHLYDTYDPDSNSGKPPYMWGRMIYGGSGTQPVCSEGSGDTYNIDSSGNYSWQVYDPATNTNCY